MHAAAAAAAAGEKREEVRAVLRENLLYTSEHRTLAGAKRAFTHYGGDDLSIKEIKIEREL